MNYSLPASLTWPSVHLSSLVTGSRTCTVNGQSAAFYVDYKRYLSVI